MRKIVLQKWLRPVLKQALLRRIYTSKHHTLCHRDCLHCFFVLFIPALLCPSLPCPSSPPAKKKSFLLVESVADLHGGMSVSREFVFSDRKGEPGSCWV